MDIRRIDSEKKRFLSLLLLADEQEDMIDRYLAHGALFALFEQGECRAVAVITREGERLCELKNLAVAPAHWRQGYGRALVGWLARHYRDKYDEMWVGTGDVPSTLTFYRRCGFRPSHRIKRFFTDHYDHPIVEEGVLLTDMVVLSMPLRGQSIVREESP